MVQPESSQANTSPINQMKKMVQQLDDVIKFALECEKRTHNVGFDFAEAKNKIAEIQNQLNILNRAYQKTLDDLGITDKDIENYKKKITESTGPEKKLFDYIGKLQKICEDSRDRIYHTLQINAQTVKQVAADSKSQKKKAQARKGKFKSVGGKKGWMPT